MIKAVAKGTRFLDIDLLKLGVSFYIVNMSLILVPSQFHLEKWSTIWQVLLLWLIIPMRVLSNHKNKFKIKSSKIK